MKDKLELQKQYIEVKKKYDELSEKYWSLHSEEIITSYTRAYPTSTDINYTIRIEVPSYLVKQNKKDKKVRLAYLKEQIKEQFLLLKSLNKQIYYES